MARKWALRDAEHDVRHQSRGEQSGGEDVRVQGAEDDVWRQAHQHRRYDLRLRERERRRPGLVARGLVTSATPIPRRRGIARQAPRVSITIRRAASAKRRLGRTELNFKFYRQATNKIVGISDGAAAFLRGFF